MNKGINSVKNGRILPINNPISLISDNNVYAKFEKKSVNKYSSYRSEMVRADGRTDVQTDGHTDGRTDTGRYIIIPRHESVAGFKNINIYGRLP